MHNIRYHVKAFSSKITTASFQIHKGATSFLRSGGASVWCVIKHALEDFFLTT